MGRVVGAKSIVLRKPFSFMPHGALCNNNTDAEAMAGDVCARYIRRLKGTDEVLQQHQHRGGSGSSVGGLNVIKTYALAKLMHKYTYTQAYKRTRRFIRILTRAAITEGGGLGEVRARG